MNSLDYRASLTIAIAPCGAPPPNNGKNGGSKTEVSRMGCSVMASFCRAGLHLLGRAHNLPRQLIHTLLHFLEFLAGRWTGKARENGVHMPRAVDEDGCWESA